MSVDHDHEPDAPLARWLTCFFCGAPTRAVHTRHIPAPFSALPLPACPDCVQAREQAHSAHPQSPRQEAK